MKKITLSTLLAIILILSFVFADNFEAGRGLITQKTPCDELTSDQLEEIGDYLMGQMHPGKLHEIMDKRMGGEGSESLRQIHINMAEGFYCGYKNAVPINRMNMMMNRGENNMMGYNYGMGYNFGIFGWILMIIFWVAIIAFIVWAIQQFTRGKESSVEILEKRYAKGEISRKQYLDMKKELRR